MLGKEKKNLIYIGSDHGGYVAKGPLKEHLEEKGFDVTDLGCFDEESCDYPEYAREVGEKVLEHKGAKGILICGSGVGMSMAANKMRGIRAVLASDEYLAEMARRHNDANVIAMGARHQGVEEMKKIVDVFLSTDFEEDKKRYARRVEAMDGISK